MKLRTIGYEAASLEEFLNALLSSGVKHVIDVRALALSRRRGFSKTRLREALLAAGIQYSHIRALGNPADGRKAARSGRMKDFNRIFRAHLATATAQEGLQLAAALAAMTPAVLLCYEGESRHCHRSIVAAALARINGFRIEHLKIHETKRKQEKRANRARTNSRQGRAPTQPTAW